MGDEDTVYRRHESPDKEEVIPQEKEHLVRQMAVKQNQKQLTPYNKVATIGYQTSFITHLKPENLEAALKKHIEDVEIEQGNGIQLLLRESQKEYKIDFALVHYMNHVLQKTGMRARFLKMDNQKVCV